MWLHHFKIPPEYIHLSLKEPLGFLCSGLSHCRSECFSLPLCILMFSILGHLHSEALTSLHTYVHAYTHTESRQSFKKTMTVSVGNFSFVSAKNSASYIVSSVY